MSWFLSFLSSQILILHYHKFANGPLTIEQKVKVNANWFKRKYIPNIYMWNFLKICLRSFLLSWIFCMTWRFVWRWLSFFYWANDHEKIFANISYHFLGVFQFNSILYEIFSFNIKKKRFFLVEKKNFFSFELNPSKVYC